jgi:hypothetical protein
MRVAGGVFLLAVGLPTAHTEQAAVCGHCHGRDEGRSHLAARLVFDIDRTAEISYTCGKAEAQYLGCWLVLSLQRDEPQR